MIWLTTGYMEFGPMNIAHGPTLAHHNAKPAHMCIRSVVFVVNTAGNWRGTIVEEATAFGVSRF